jgi:hypothetical protein
MMGRGAGPRPASRANELVLGAKNKGKSWDVDLPINIGPIKPGAEIASNWDFTTAM